MTPYAVLLAKPADSDDTIRKLYYAIANEEHPDRTGVAVTERWHAATEAYAAVKTEERRTAWLKQQRLLAKRCTSCDGFGVQGTRMFKGKIRLCDACDGNGAV
jgi:DnaJ-class molecular chaperone